MNFNAGDCMKLQKALWVRKLSRCIIADRPPKFLLSLGQQHRAKRKFAERVPKNWLQEFEMEQVSINSR